MVNGMRPWSPTESGKARRSTTTGQSTMVTIFKEIWASKLGHRFRFSSFENQFYELFRMESYQPDGN
jgi:hypothetical protein